MDSLIFKEYLHWFDQRMAGWNVVLLLDNFSGYIKADEAIQNSGLKLQNTTLIWLPPNSTSQYQPLDQGIIAIFKGYWRKRWIRYMIDEFDAGRDPLDIMDVLKAI